MVSLPYVLSGTVYDTDGSTAFANSVTVTLRNERTNETITTTTDSSSNYRLDAANLSSAYANGDVVTIFVVYTNYEDYQEHTIDTSLGGYTVDFTLESVPASNSLKIVTVQEINSYLNLTLGSNNASDLTTNDLVTVGRNAEAWVEDVCNRKFDTNSGSYYTATDEYHDCGYQQSEFFLKHIPVYSITSLSVNENTEEETQSWTALTETTHYEVDYTTGRIKILDDDDYPASGVQQIKVTYTYGESTPEGVKRLVCMVILRDLAMSNSSANLVKGRSLDVSSVNFEYISQQIDRAITRYGIAGIDSVG